MTSGRPIAMEAALARQLLEPSASTNPQISFNLSNKSSYNE
jgi:hypothetical protein